MILFYLLMLIAFWAAPTSAESSAVDQGIESIMGGPSSVGATLQKDQETEPTVKIDLLDSYFAFKQRMVDDHGVSFGLDYFALIQAASEDPGKDMAAGGVFRAYGSWTLAGRDGGRVGRQGDDHYAGTQRFAFGALYLSVLFR